MTSGFNEKFSDGGEGRAGGDALEAYRDVVASVQVTVEERRIVLDGVAADNWRSHVFTGLEAVPEMLPATFSTEAEKDAAPLRRLVAETCAKRRAKATFHLPYVAGEGGKKEGTTVLRTVEIAVGYRAG